MGRYFQHSFWPLNDFELTAAFQTIPASRVGFHSSGGVHLVIYQLDILNDTAGAGAFTVEPILDDAALQFDSEEGQVAVGQTRRFSNSILLELAEGRHSLHVRAFGLAAVGDVVLSAKGRLLAIEFPSWESSDRIEGP